MPLGDVVRVTLVPSDAEGTVIDALQIIIDMIADIDTQQAIGPFPAFGRIGDFKQSETLIPFTLMGDGRIDCGVYAPVGASDDRLMIRGARVAVGEKIARVAGDQSLLYQIAGVTRLLGN